MGLLDWLRGGPQGDEARDSQEERLDVRREESVASAEAAQELEPTAQERRDSEAARHSGI